MKNIIKLLGYLSLMYILTVFVVIIYNKDENMNKYKIIKNSDNIQLGKEQFKINPYDSWYYTDATIGLIDDSCYYVILWGNRDSRWWWILRDQLFFVDVPYNEYRNINTDKDKEILKILHEKIIGD